MKSPLFFDAPKYHQFTTYQLSFILNIFVKTVLIHLQTSQIIYLPEKVSFEIT